MPIISIANSKGGAGKSTTALVLGLEFARQAKVAIIDADPNSVIYRWGERRKKEGLSLPLTIVSRPAESQMVNTVNELSHTHQIVIIDLEGTASTMLTRALVKSHLVLIPLNPSQLDADQAAMTVQLLFDEGQVFNRVIPYQLLWSRYPIIKSRSFKQIEADIKSQNLSILKAALVERAAYRDIFATNKTLDEMLNMFNGIKDKLIQTGSTKKAATKAVTDNIDRIEAAQANAHALAAAVVETLESISI